MKVFKKIMNAVAAVENCILVVSTLLILVLTVGNVFSRKVIHRSWSFTEELVVPIGSGCMILHFIEYCLDYCTGNLKKEDK